MAAPHVVQLSEVGFNSKTRTVKGLSLQLPDAIIYDDTAQYPLNSRQAPQAGPKFARCSFVTELNPSGSSGGAKTPPDALLFKACGIKETVATTVSTTYDFDGLLTTTAVNLIVKQGVGTGYYQLCSNAVGNLTMSMSPNTPILCAWNFDGTYTAPTEADLTDSLDNGGYPPMCIGTITLNSDALVMKSFSIALNNATNGPNLNMAATNGVSNPVLVNQAPTFETVVELPAMATANYWTDLTGHQLTPFSFAIGTGAGYVITITGKGYLVAAQQLQSLNGVLGARLSYRMDWASGSPISIAFT